MHMKTLVIIPAYNEEESILSTVSSLKLTVPGIDYVVVNDGSSDNTKAICVENDFNTVNLPVNMGLAGGFQTGMKYAQYHGFDAALQFDADGQHIPEYVASFIEAMEATGDDMVIGSRFITKKKHFSARMIGSTLLTVLIKLTTGKTITDPTSGMRLYNRRMIEAFSSGHDLAPEPDTIAYLIRKGATVHEIPIEVKERAAGESYLSATKSIGYMMRACVSILILQWFR